jgi:hypothetical protein
MNSLLQSIRDSPLSFLPRESLPALRAFKDGYSWRHSLEGMIFDWGLNGREFHRWLCGRFRQSYAESIADITIVSSHSTNEVDAFQRYFSLLNEYIDEGQPVEKPIKWDGEPADFAGVIKAIRDKPALYIGSASFLCCSAYLMGDERAFLDLQLSGEKSREVFREFQTWVETEKSHSETYRPWFKVIEFWSGGLDSSSHPRFGAFSLFFSWLDEYSENIGKPGLFRLIGPRREGQVD